jgi:hypothetical protein
MTDASVIIRYIKDKTFTDGNLNSISDTTYWTDNNVIIDMIKVVTDSTNWTLTLYSSSNTISGMYASIVLADQINGNKDLILDIPYVDYDNNQQVHLLFVDNAASNGATISVYGTKAT